MDSVAVAGVCAVVVAFRPDPLQLSDLLVALRPQVGGMVVVDNTGEVSDGKLAGLVAAAGGVLMERPENGGLASAQNIGIASARSHGFSHVLLSDQDSVPAPGMVATLYTALIRLGEAGPVAAVGPAFRDLREVRQAPFVRIRFPFNRKCWCEHPEQTVACDFLISSGSLIPLAVLDVVGPMDESLFIDSVDLEWSFRALRLGYELHGVCGAGMYHRLGDARRLLPLGLGQVVVHGPTRLYYIMRNRLRLYGMRHTPRRWIAQDIPRMLVKLFLFGVLIGPRQRNLSCMIRGIIDGFRGKSGPCPPNW